MNNAKNYYFLITPIFLLFLNCIIWLTIFFPNINSRANNDLKIYFLNVGQGDSELIILPGGVKILVDAGPDRSVLRELSKVLPFDDHYIDLLVSSHPQLDHFNGFSDVLDRYQVGAFIYNGRSGEVEAWGDFADKLKKNHIPVLTLGEGDNIKFKESLLEVLGPSVLNQKSNELNDTVLALLLDSKNTKALFAGDLGKELEEALVKKYKFELDILKVSHHGSRFSTSENFLKFTRPKVAVIEVGKNRYGHPTKEVLENLKNFKIATYRTDKSGRVFVLANGLGLKIVTEKPLTKN